MDGSESWNSIGTVTTTTDELIGHLNSDAFNIEGAITLATTSRLMAVGNLQLTPDSTTGTATLTCHLYNVTLSEQLGSSRTVTYAGGNSAMTMTLTGASVEAAGSYLIGVRCRTNSDRTINVRVTPIDLLVWAAAR